MAAWDMIGHLIYSHLPATPSWDTISGNTEVFVVSKHASLSHASMLMYILFPCLAMLST